MRVHDAMTAEVTSVTPGRPARVAVDLLLRLGVSGLPLLDQDRTVVGTVTEMDLIRAYRRGADLDRLSIAEVATRRPRCITPEDDLYRAVALMEEWQIRRLPVVEDGRLRGIVSRHDVLRALAGEAAPSRTITANGRTGRVPCGSGRPCTCISTANTWE